MLTRLEIHHSATRAAERVARWHNILRSRLLMLMISVALSAVIFVWQRARFNGLGVTILVLACVVPLGWVVVAFVWGQLAKRDLAAVGEGIAMTMDARSVTIGDLDAPWNEVRRFTTRTRGPGRSPLLLLERADGATASLALDHLDVLPSQIDDAARAWTSGRVGLDLAGTGVN